MRSQHSRPFAFNQWPATLSPREGLVGVGQNAEQVTDRSALSEQRVVALLTSLPQWKRNFSPSERVPKPVPPYSLLLVNTNVPDRPSAHINIPSPETTEVGRSNVPLQETPACERSLKVPVLNPAVASPMKSSFAFSNRPTTGAVVEQAERRMEAVAARRSVRIVRCGPKCSRCREAAR